MVWMIDYFVMLVAFSAMSVAFYRQRQSTRRYRQAWLDGVKVIEQVDANRRELEAINVDLTMQAELLLDQLDKTREQASGLIAARERTIDRADAAAKEMRETLEEYRLAELTARSEIIESRRAQLVAKLRGER
jgi:DNA anti-recombination protein RmuC